jgi:hypothetical protein
LSALRQKRLSGEKINEGQKAGNPDVDRRELGDEVWSLARRLAGEDNRLVVTNAPAFSRETAEVAHEALIRHWPKLVGWIDGDRRFQTWLRQIRSNVELWSADPSDDGPLRGGGMLAQARDWLTQRCDDFNAAELGYIETSIALRFELTARARGDCGAVGACISGGVQARTSVLQRNAGMTTTAERAASQAGDNIAALQRRQIDTMNQITRIALHGARAS